jgi:hypothetical protein
VRSREGLERKRLRDRARMRALTTVSSYHRDEHSCLYHAEVGGSQQARWNRAMAEVARRYDNQYRAEFAAELAVLGYEPHPCNSHPAALLSASETSGTGAALTARSLPEPPLEGSEMAEGMR